MSCLIRCLLIFLFALFPMVNIPILASNLSILTIDQDYELSTASSDGNITGGVLAILKAGADVYAPDIRGHSAFYMAMENQHTEIVKLLIIGLLNTFR